MKAQEKTLQSLAQEMLDNFEHKTRDNGKGFYCQKSPAQEWITNICHEAHGDRFPSDDVYEVIIEALEKITETDNEDEAQDCLMEIEADVYTSDLADWLGNHNYNVYYLTEAIENGTKDGFQALAQAQWLWKNEIATIVLQELQNRLDEIE